MPAQSSSLPLAQAEAIRPRSVVQSGSFRPAAWRFVGLWLIVSFFALIYHVHPYYHRPFFSVFQALLINLYGWFCLLGFFYVWLTYRRRRRVRDDFSDVGLLALSLVRHSWRALRSHSWTAWRRYWRSPRVKLLLLILGVKFFFVPLMIVFLAGHVTEAYRLWHHPDSATSGLEWASWGMALTYQLIFLCDTAVALVGYSIESLWLKNKTRSVDRTWSGWLVCLMCYPPFSETAGLYLPLAEGGNALGFGTVTLLILRALALVFFAIYLWATLALGVRFSNLSNKGIIARGPYYWVRHPAYVCKNLAWWVEKLPTMAGFHNVLPLLAWNLVYALRGLTEERHLRADPAYRAYCEQVRYRFIPGVW
jgi:protein-S-isoprenylcysteine O-methyltransferase Ste14